MKFDPKTTNAMNILCGQIIRAWQNFGEDRNRENEIPHSDWAMAATLAVWDTIAQSTKVEMLNVAMNIEGLDLVKRTFTKHRKRK